MDYSRSVLRLAVAQLCSNMGWQSIQSTPLEVLTDIMERYILTLGRKTHAYAEQAGRCDPILADLSIAFKDCGVSEAELADYLKHVDPAPLGKGDVQYPVPQPSKLQFPRPNSRELKQRPEHIPDHLPPIHPELDDEIVEPSPQTPMGGLLSPPFTPMQISPGTSQTGQGQGEKRPAQGDMETPPAAKKARLLQEEDIPYSNYRIQNVAMSPSGLPMAMGGTGRLPQARTPPPPTPSEEKPAPLFTPPSGSEEAMGISPVKISEEPTPVCLKKEPQTPINISELPTQVAAESQKEGSKPVAKPKMGRPPKKRARGGSVSPSRAAAEIKSPKAGKSPKGTGRSPKGAKSPRGGKSPKGSKAGSTLQQLLVESKQQNKPETLPRTVTTETMAVPVPQSQTEQRKPFPTGKIIRTMGSGDSPVPYTKERPTKGALKEVLLAPPREPAKPTPALEDESPEPQLVIDDDEARAKGRLDKAAKKERMAKYDDIIDSVINQSSIEHGDGSAGKTSQAKEEAKMPSPMKAPSSPVIAPTSVPSGIKEGKKTKKRKTKTGKNKAEKQKVLDSPKPPVVESSAEKAEPEHAKPEVKVFSPKKQPTPSHSPQKQKKQTEDIYTFDEPDIDLPPPVLIPVAKSPEQRKEAKPKLKIKMPGGGSSESDIGSPATRPPSRSSGTPEMQPKVAIEKMTPEDIKKFEFPQGSPTKSPPSQPSIVAPIKFRIKKMPEGHMVGKRLQELPCEEFRDREKEGKEEKKKDKEKKKKKKDKDRSKDKKERSKEKSERKKEKKEKRREKEREKEQNKAENSGPTIPKLTLKYGLGSSATTTSVTGSGSEESKTLPKLVIQRQKETAKLSPVKTPSPFRETSAPPPKEPTPSPPRVPTPPPVRAHSPSPQRQPTPSPEREPSPVRVPSQSPEKSESLPSTREASMGSLSPTSPPQVPSVSPPPQHRVSRSPSPALHSPSASPSPPPPPTPAPRSPTPSSIPALSPSPAPPKSPSPAPVISSPPTPKPLKTVTSPSRKQKGKHTSKSESDSDDEDINVTTPPPKGGSAVKASVIRETEGKIKNEKGEIVWICPACKMPDDGTAMVGCDNCDDWYHWPCVGITEEPSEEEWYCPKAVCQAKRKPKKPKGRPARGRGRGRGKKKV